jgi:hypothetical protein
MGPVNLVNPDARAGEPPAAQHGLTRPWDHAPAPKANRVLINCGPQKLDSSMSEPLGQKCSACLERLRSGVESADIGHEPMRHPHPNVHLGIDARRDGALHIAA